MNHPIRLLAGARAARRIAEHGVLAEDVAAVAAAAGGPKGLAMIPLDRFLFGHWLTGAPRPRALIGASIGAWRMAAGAQTDPLAALTRLEHAYLEGQRYPLNPSPAQVSKVCRELTRELIGGHAPTFCSSLNPAMSLQVITARSASRSRRLDRAVFLRAAVANVRGREILASHLQRVVFTTGQDPLGAALPSDRFATRMVQLGPDNLEDALLASGSIPLVAEPVRSIAGAPAGDYWDGGLIDYHPFWPYHALEGLVLIPHFVPWLTAGWLDKFLPWRRHGIGSAGQGWLDNVLMVVPSASLLARLPGGRLPDRQDFHRHGMRHDDRLRDWRRAIGECEAMAEGFADFVQDPARFPIEALS